MNRPEPNAGLEGKSVERQKAKFKGLFFEQQLQKLIENRETFANASEIARIYPDAELAFRNLKDNPMIRISEQILRSIWPSVHEWVYADALAQIRFSPPLSGRQSLSDYFRERESNSKEKSIPEGRADDLESRSTSET